MADEVAANPAPMDPMVGQQLGTESALSTYVGPYVTDMLGRGQALGQMDYQGYMGPLTAGESAAQQSAFTGIANLTVPTDQMERLLPATLPIRVWRRPT